MDKKFSVLKFFSQVFTLYGVTTLVLNIFCVVFGRSAWGISTIFSLGKSGVGVETSLEFLAAVFLINGWKLLITTDFLIKKMSLSARIILLFAGAFGIIFAFIILFGWFPIDMPIAWIMFILCFVVSCTVSTLISVLAERQENRRLEEALKRYKEEQ